MRKLASMSVTVTLVLAMLAIALPASGCGGEGGQEVTKTVKVGESQYARLQRYLADAASRGIDTITLAGSADPAQRLLPPTLLIEPGDDATVMQEEIFGPLLPIKGYRSLDENAKVE